MNSSDGVGLNNYLVIVAASGYEYNIRYSIPCSYKSIIVIFVGENEAITRNVDGGRKKLFGAATIYIFTIHYYTLSDYSAHLDPLFSVAESGVGRYLAASFCFFSPFEVYLFELPSTINTLRNLYSCVNNITTIPNIQGL